MAMRSAQHPGDLKSRRDRKFHQANAAASGTRPPARVRHRAGSIVFPNSPGNIVVQSSRVAKVEPHKRGRDRLEQLWAAFQKRHPNYMARFGRRDAVVKNIGKRFVTAERTGVALNIKIGRNDACPVRIGPKIQEVLWSSPVVDLIAGTNHDRSNGEFGLPRCRSARQSYGCGKERLSTFRPH
jgi:hypothetical protein